jgi:2,5-diketo-D-gluconate reductase A
MDRYVETWRALIKLRDEKRAASIGVSNFTMTQLQRLIGETGVPPALNQVEIHPQFQQPALRDFHRENDIATQAWSPLAFGKALENGTVRQIARKHQRTPAQIVLRWHLEIGNLVIPKTIDPGRMAENIDVFGFKLDEEDLGRISMLDRPDGRTGPDPERFGVENSRSAWGRRIASLLHNPSNFGRRLRRYMRRQRDAI